jgi:hypothetical protein
MKKLLLSLMIAATFLPTAFTQTMFKVNQYNIYYDKTFMPVLTLFTNHQVSSRFSAASYCYVNATSDHPVTGNARSWGEVLAGGLYTPVPGISVGVLAGFQSNEAQVFRISPIIMVSKNRFTFFGAFEFGGERIRWDCMGFYNLKSLKLGGELIRYYKMYAAGPRAELSFFKKQPVTIFYSALWDWKGSKLASMFGIYTSFGTPAK